jgi:hypothetical protein
MATTGGVAVARDTIKSTLISKGPLSVSMAMGGTFNSSGVYKCPAGATVNHAVVIVGYNDAGQFWMVRNSWGSTWDKDGYFKVGYGQCQIENYVYYVTATNPQVPTLLSPNGVTLDTTPAYKWMPVSEATQYQYALMKGSAAVYAMTVPASVCGTTCTSTPSTVLTAGTYSWRVRAMVGGVWKPFSAYKSFTLGTGFISNFTTDANGWASVSGPWSLARSNFYQTPGVVYTFSSARHTGSYANFLYEARVKRTSSQPYWANNIIVRGSPNGLGSLNVWSNGYLFEYANSGAFAVFRVNGTSVTTLKQWTASSAIAQGDWNVLRVAASSSTLKFYINDTLVWRGTDSTLATGQVGIMMYRDGTSTGNRLYVDWARLAMTSTASPAEEPLASGVEIPGGDLTQAPH